MTFVRKRISERLAAAGRQPLTLLAAPAGYGKSVALDHYLGACGTPVLRFDVRRTHSSLTRFVRAFAAALEPAFPRIGQSLAIAHERATQSPKPSAVLAHWLAGHLEGQALTLVIDDLHHCEGDRAIAAFIAGAVEHTSSHVRWIVAMRSSADLPVATWLARGDVAIPLDEHVFRMNADDARGLAHGRDASLPPATIDRLLETCEGVISTFAFGLETIADHPETADRILSSGGDAFGRFASEVLQRFTPDERAQLVESAAFPELDTAPLAALAARAPQIVTTRGGRTQYHDSFLGVLGARLRELGSDAVREATDRAAAEMERAGRIGDALALYIRERRDAELVRVIEAHGFAFHEAGYGESIVEAIGALDPLVQTTSAVVLAIKAMSESSSGRFDTAESWFQLSIDRAAEPLRSQIAYQYGNHLIRNFRREAVDVFETMVADPALEPKLRAYALAALGPAYIFERRVADARRCTAEALELAREVNVAHLIAKAHHQASYVALYGGEAERAKRLASVSLAHATEHGYYDIAAGALSVLCNVASDIDDDPEESVRLLDAVEDNAAKSGSLVNQLIALVASLEIEIERNNEDAAERIDEKLRALDVSFAGRATYEALLPTQALRASWAGDFLGAYRLLSNSGENPWSDDRKALRYAEIGFYAAAAGLTTEATEGVRRACEILGTIDEVDLRVQRARLYVALAAIVLGRSEFAAEILARVDASPGALSLRLVALRRALDTLAERYRGARNHNDVLAALAEMDASGLAGVSRAIAMVPMADNAAHRVGRLSLAERAAALLMADGDPSPMEARFETIARKLGCTQREGVVRAAIWHRAAFETAPVDTYTTGRV